MEMTIYIKDSTKDMIEIPTSTIDLIITSPPYWNLRDYEHQEQLGVGLTYRHFFHVLKQNMLECMRVLKEDAFAIFIVGDICKKVGYGGRDDCNARSRIYSLHSDIIQFFNEMDFDFYTHIIWEKTSVKSIKKPLGATGKGDLRDRIAPPFNNIDLSNEHILVFRKPGMKRKLPLNKRLLDECTAIYKDDWKTWSHPVWRDIEPSHSSEHPAPFPDKLAARLIRMYSVKNDTILDPFVGSGTTLNVSLKLQRNAIGYDVRYEYVKSLVEQYQLKAINCQSEKLATKFSAMVSIDNANGM